MTATTTTIIDDRPLSVKLSEALKEHELVRKAAIGAAVGAGAGAGAGIGYVNYVIAMAFYGWIQMPGWFMTIAMYSGYFTIAYLAATGAYLAYAFLRD